MSILLSLIAIPLMTLLNRLRGGGWWAIHLPGHPRWYVTAAATILAMVLTRDLVAGFLFGMAYGVWSLLPWGHLYSFGRWTPARPASHLERALLEWSQYRYWLAMLMLHAIGVVALGPLVWWEWPGPELSATILMPFLIVCAYEIGWTFEEKNAISRSEMLTGAIWGGYLILVGL